MGWLRPYLLSRGCRSFDLLSHESSGASPAKSGRSESVMKKNRFIDRISWATAEDQQALIPLFLALYAHDVPEAAAPELKEVEAHISLLTDPNTPHRLAIAWSRDGLAMALAAVAVFVSVSDPRRDHWRQVELKELFVLSEFRGHEIGAALFDWVEDWAVANRVSRMDWHVKSDNHRGVSFYEARGAEIVRSRLSMRKRLKAKL